MVYDCCGILGDCQMASYFFFNKLQYKLVQLISFTTSLGTQFNRVYYEIVESLSMFKGSQMNIEFQKAPSSFLSCESPFSRCAAVDVTVWRNFRAFFWQKCSFRSAEPLASSLAVNASRSCSQQAYKFKPFLVPESLMRHKTTAEGSQNPLIAHVSLQM